ncbi:hypothetical protein AQZ52_02920 [Novosphingobium fuchskuhlense]|uniref:Uncharacterized protein n=1 Tax=Novosphingobium fuchskuhlense TaxID=1117702 RepID=A0A117UWN3_9SPHN|nr:hypothetical protein [Novosphingobium fuchskuhlense]KUR72249.1 hypothetical protein AQZ52_02920 [Novosphingobium fuchskuhlense]
MNVRHLLALPALLALAACGGSSDAVRPLPPPPAPKGIHPAPPAVIQTQRPKAHLQVLPGLEGVIGADADALTRQFGTPRLDVREGDSRKLQWSGVACVLDAYLYPPDGGGRPTATYVDARRGDGRDVDRAACVAALRQSPQRR